VSTGARHLDPTVDRLSRFRDLRARLDPSGDPNDAVANGLYVRSKHAPSSRLAAELALAPASTHLLVGGVGSGKTTELLETARRLDALDDSIALYVDVTSGNDIGHVKPGTVLVQVGLALADIPSDAGGARPASDDRDGPLTAWTLNRGLSDEVRQLQTLAHGEVDDSDFGAITVPGILKAPERPFDLDVAAALEPTERLVRGLQGVHRHVSVLLDGLDRIANVRAFQEIIEEDVRALTSLGVGVVLVGPLRALYGIDRTALDQFDRLHEQPSVDVQRSDEAASFFKTVLRRRAPEDVLDSQALEALVHHSGGVLRDLLALAQSACVEAYVDGSEIIGLVQADAAIDAFGRRLMQGLRSSEIEILQRVRTKGTFVQTKEDDLALLMTRRVLEYRESGVPRYAVHPTIERFLAEMAAT